MSAPEQIENAVCRLSPMDFAAFRAWFVELDVDAWDRQIEEGTASGRLDALVEEALDDLSRGRSSPAETSDQSAASR